MRNAAPVRPFVLRSSFRRVVYYDAIATDGGSPIRTMTCRELGGPCDQELKASSWDDMVQAMTQHVLENHPDTAKEMKEMHEADPKKWGREMKPKWDAKSES
jgi:predicted small metal-binding protein